MSGPAHDAVSSTGGMSREEIRELSRLKSCGDMDAREKLILAHLRLVQSCARRYAGQGVPFEDLYQEGCYGLIRAIDLYEYRPDSTLQAFARHHINKFIQAALIQQNDSNPISLSEEYYYMLRRYQKAYAQLSSELGRPPTTKELSENLDLSAKYIYKLNCVLFRYTSLNEPLSQRDKSSSGTKDFSEIIAATPDTPRPTEHAALSLLSGQENIMHQILTKREEEVIARRIGKTPNGRVQTYPEISAEMGFSVETARRAFASGIRKLRSALDVELSRPKKQAQTQDCP